MGSLGVFAAAKDKEDGTDKKEGGSAVMVGVEEGGLVSLLEDKGRHRLLTFGWGIVAAVEGELGADFRVGFSGLGVVEGVSGLTIVDEDLRDVSDGGLHRFDHDLFAVG